MSETTTEIAEPEVAATEAAPAPSIRDTLASVLAKYPDRGSDGRFEPRFPREGGAADEAAPVETTTDQPEAKAEAEPAAPVIEPPASWSADQKAKWSSLPPDVQQYVAQRESEAHKAISEKGSRAAMFDAVEAAIGEHKTALVSEYGSVDRAVNTLVNVAMRAGQDPEGFVRWFAQQHRIDLARIAGQPGEPAQADPLNHLSAKVDTLASRIEQQQRESALMQQIREFSSEKGADGKPLRPYFEDVRETMAGLMQSGLAANLDEAYQKAVRVNDAVIAKVRAEQEAAKRAEAERAAKAAETARQAKAVNIRSSSQVNGSPARKMTPRETMEAVARRAFAGVS